MREAKIFFSDAQGFVRRKSSSPELNFFISRRATHRYRKKKRDFTEDPKKKIWRIQIFRVRKCFEASYGFYYISRGRDFSYFGFIPTFGMILGLIVRWFYVVFMACFMSWLWHVLCRVCGMFCGLN